MGIRYALVAICVFLGYTAYLKFKRAANAKQDRW